MFGMKSMAAGLMEIAFFIELIGIAALVYSFDPLAFLIVALGLIIWIIGRLLGGFRVRRISVVKS